MRIDGRHGWAVAGLAVLALARVFGRRVRRRALEGKVAFVAGGSRGLGLLLADELAQHGARIVLCARDLAELERARTLLEQGGAEVVIVAADLEEPADLRSAVIAACEAFGTIDVLVNNAGTMEVGPATEMTDASYEHAMNVHFWAPLRLMQDVVPLMRASGGGRIINISSIGGIVSVPHMLPYSASKFALTGLSEGMHAELAADGIAVTTVCPGLMRTGSVGHATFRGRREKEHALFSILAALPLFSMSAQRAARKIVRASLRRRPFLVLSWQAKLAGRAHGVAPGLVDRLFALANRLLPAPPSRPREAKPGHAIARRQYPSWVTALNDRAAQRYNET